MGGRANDSFGISFVLFRYVFCALHAFPGCRLSEVWVKRQQSGANVVSDRRREKDVFDSATVRFSQRLMTLFRLFVSLTHKAIHKCWPNDWSKYDTRPSTVAGARIVGCCKLRACFKTLTKTNTICFCQGLCTCPIWKRRFHVLCNRWVRWVLWVLTMNISIYYDYALADVPGSDEQSTR